MSDISGIIIFSVIFAAVILSIVTGPTKMELFAEIGSAFRGESDADVELRKKLEALSESLEGLTGEEINELRKILNKDKQEG